MPRTTSYDVTEKLFPNNFTTPANTPAQVQTWDLRPYVLKRMEILIPEGHVALTGIRFGMQGTPLLPWDPNLPTVQGNNERLVYQLDTRMWAPLTVTTANNDGVPHTFYCIAVCADIELASDRVAATILPVRL